MDKVSVVIVAGGSGKRMGLAIKKQYILLKEKEILAHTIEAFENCEFINEIILVVAEEDIDYVQENIVIRYDLNKVKKIAAGGSERQDSVYNGLLKVDRDTNYVMIHDGARPFISKKVILNCLKKAKETGASIVAVPVKDTIKICDTKTHQVEQTPNRDTLWAVQTPQIFSFELLMKAYQHAKANHLQVTDDSMIVEALGKEVYITQGEYTNIKVTTAEDLIIAEAILNEFR
ncbi:2-C-methyl-D-erythritol 4-phosphate cytidylyltransferase [Cellulosilyticum sp. I15G10I2]|uniref:2-C-methyl-D-erythritol 4-phosphate cytidylyltransferase n=1 Tax=Cellulosilyticum sp. I15G10I2 TaxID=1892843 RepID=UPI00085CDF1A|nr:2-C-methyl-D-erythritol 4-phosphate cytidylyltransferase [Cellulosilyticum sp. I15G10I2]